jgi:hypothetical protein
MKSTNRRIIAGILILGIISSSFMPNTIGFAKETIQKITNGSKSIDHHVIDEITPAVPETLVLQSSIGQSEMDTFVPEGAQKLTEMEIQELFDEGFSMTDIFKAQELTTLLNKDVQSLLRDKHKGNKNWSEIELEGQPPVFKREENKLRSSYIKETKQLAEDGFSLIEQSLLLSIHSENRNVSLETLITSYRNDPDAFMKRYSKVMVKSKKISTKQLKSYDLVEKDIEDLGELDFERLEELAGKSNQSVKDLVKQLRKLHKSSKEGQ